MSDTTIAALIAVLVAIILAVGYYVRRLVLS